MGVRITLCGKNRAISQVQGYLAPGLFEEYLATVKSRGGLYQKDAGGHLLILSTVPDTVRILKGKGLPVFCDPRVEAQLGQLSLRAHRDVHQAKSRMDASDRRLGEKYRLTAIQRAGVEWLAARDNGLLGDGIGIGKTAEALFAIPDWYGAVVTVPASLAGAWVNEIELWRPDLETYVVDGSNKWRWPDAGEVVLCSYDRAPVLSPTDVPLIPTVLIPDEAHRVKNAKAKRTERIQAMAKIVREHDGKVWLVTGTPLINKPTELWNVLKVADLHLEAFGSWPRFVDLMGGVQGDWAWEWGTPTEMAKIVLARVMLRRTPQVGIGPVRRQAIPVKIDRTTRKACDISFDAFQHIGVAIFNSPGNVASWSKAREALARSKIPAMLEIVDDFEEANEPLIVFSSHLAPLDALAGRPNWRKLTGDTPAVARTNIVADFQAGKLQGLAISTLAGGEGLTLTRAANALFVDLPLTPAAIQQAEGRLNRTGQTRRVLIKRLVADHPLDRRTQEIILAKTELTQVLDS